MATQSSALFLQVVRDQIDVLPVCTGGNLEVTGPLLLSLFQNVLEVF